MKIYFETGKLTQDPQLPLRDIYLVDASDGVVNNYNILSIIQNSNKDACVYTNSPIALNSAFTWDKDDEYHNVLIRNIIDNKFIPISEAVFEEFNEGSDLLDVILEYYV